MRWFWKRRLEAATSRLEDIAVASAPPVAQTQHAPSTRAAAPAAPPPPPGPPPIPESLKEWDEIIVEANLKPFVAFTKSFAGDMVIEQVCNNL